MTKTHSFSLALDDSPVEIVLNKITSFKPDGKSGGIMIKLDDGQAICVKASMEEITELLKNNA